GEARVLAPPRGPPPLVNRPEAHHSRRAPPAANARGWPAQVPEDRSARGPCRVGHEGNEPDDFERRTWWPAGALNLMLVSVERAESSANRRAPRPELPTDSRAAEEHA